MQLLYNVRKGDNKTKMKKKQKKKRNKKKMKKKQKKKKNEKDNNGERRSTTKVTAMNIFKGAVLGLRGSPRVSCQLAVEV